MDGFTLILSKNYKSDKNPPGDFRVTEEVESVNLRERVRRVRLRGGGRRSAHFGDELLFIPDFA